jgi:arylsulfatase A-like enzyme
MLDTMDKLDLWKDTLVIFTTDHGTYNGDHGRMGKLQTHEHDAVGHIPFIAAHPEYANGERRSQLVQLVDIYPTVLSAVGKPIPENIHGINLIEVLKNKNTSTRKYAISGQFGTSITITDGEWILHQSPVDSNSPLYWYGHCLAKFIPYKLGPYDDGRRKVLECGSWSEATWLSDKRSDPNELNNIAGLQPEKLAEMQQELKKTLFKLGAPAEQFVRLGI